MAKALAGRLARVFAEYLRASAASGTSSASGSRTRKLKFVSDSLLADNIYSRVLAYVRRPMIVLAGAHSAGKTTSAALLSERGYIPHAELGWVLRRAVAASAPGVATLRGANLEWFDEILLELELARDEFLASADRLPHCVESWHLGNLAYARLRSPRLVKRFEAVVQKQIRSLRPIVVFLRITSETFRNRVRMDDLSVDELATHYGAIQEALAKDFELFGIQPVVIDNDGTIEQLERQLDKVVSLACGETDELRFKGG